ncbi:MAG: hypothetical protein OSJ70_08820 [Bacilli bacterium]|nr:hypothetical protein [Bacilli bacterium]
MKTIKIAHLYYDLMNLYGEQGNILALKEAFKRQGVKTSIDKLTKDDKMDLAKYDIIYIGCGNESSQEIVRKDILKHKKSFTNIVKTKTIIATGNAWELFGKKINEKEALGIFDYSSVSSDNRIINEQINKVSFLDKPIIGFQNRGSVNNNTENDLFEVIKGTGNTEDVRVEGIKVNNFYGTYTIGPLLIRNPHLTDYIIKHILDENKIPYKEILNTPDYDAYNAFIKNFNIK